jgi:hypothetical protein
MRVKWYGEQLKAKMDKAVPLAIDYITSNCVREAKVNVPVKTAVLQGSIQMRMAEKKTTYWSGLWGSWACNYALPVEFGTAPHKIYPVNKKALFWPGADHPVGSVNHPGTKENQFLRPAADKLYPELAGKIKEAMASV